LVTTLDGCFDPSLVGYIASLGASWKEDAAVEIQNTGAVGSSAASAVSVTFGNGTQTQMPVEWIWKGRIFEAFENEYEINCRFVLRTEVEGKKCLRLSFITKNEKRVIAAAHADVVKALRIDMPENVQIYAGSFIAGDKAF
jgi:hypothetical protein